MSSHAQLIGCFSNQQQLQNVFRSMIRVLSQFAQSGLKQDWVYSEQGPLDVYIFDLDDESNRKRLIETQAQQATVIAISSHPDRLLGQQYALQKPLRSQSLLQVLKHIEGAILNKSKIPAESASSESQIGAPVLISMPTNATPQAAAVQRHQLQHWPDLTRISQTLLPEAARVCALLALRPASSEEIAHVLGIDGSDLTHILSAITQCSHPQYPALLLHANSSAGSVKQDSTHLDKPTSLLSKLWNRLKGAA